MSGRLGEIARLFLKLGTIGFGGPATHLALMEDETVQRRGWLTRQQFVDLVGATNLIPGPNSTELAIHIGFLRGGLPGLFVAGVCFIVPAVAITIGFAWLYVSQGQRPEMLPLIAGIKPAVLAIIFTAGWRLGRKVLNGRIVAVVAAAVGGATILGLGEVSALLGGGLLGTLALLYRRRSPRERRPDELLGAALLAVPASSPLAAWSGSLTAGLAAAGASVGPVTITQLGLFFLKVGAVLYGTGYVLVAYLHGGLVERYGWLNEDQLLDAIAIGQFTPGPILSTATFIGYLVMAQQGGHLSGLVGAVVATACVFLPSFLLVLITAPLVPRLRNRRWTAAFLDAVNAASMGLMAAVVIKLAVQIFFPSGVWRSPSWSAVLIAAVATAATLRWRINAVWLVLGGAATGLMIHLVDRVLGS